LDVIANGSQDSVYFVVRIEFLCKWFRNVIPQVAQMRASFLHTNLWNTFWTPKYQHYKRLSPLWILRII